MGSHGIEPTFLKLDLWSPGAGFIPIIPNLQCIKLDKENRNQEKK